MPNSTGRVNLQKGNAAASRPEQPSRSPNQIRFDEAEGSSATHGKRHGCAWSFETLDPNHADVNKRSFVACYSCKRIFIKGNWPGKCHRCESEHFTAIEIPPTPELLFQRRKPLPYTSGPLNSLTDQPLGLSSGTIFCNGREPKVLFFRNNSETPIEIPSDFGPAWISVSWRRQLPTAGQLEFPSSEDRGVWIANLQKPCFSLQPDRTVAAVVRAHTFRPAGNEVFFDFNEEQGCLFASHQDAWIVNTVGYSLLGLAILHLLIGPQPFFCAILLGMLITLLCVFSPKRFTQLFRQFGSPVPFDQAFTCDSSDPVSVNWLLRVLVCIPMGLMVSLVLWTANYAVIELLTLMSSVLLYLVWISYGAAIFVVTDLWMCEYGVGLTHFLKASKQVHAD